MEDIARQLSSKEVTKVPIESQAMISTFLMLMAGHLLKVLAKKIQMPFTVLVCLAGFFVGLIPGVAGMDVMTKVWMDLDPHFMLFLFLPALIFESAFNCDYYTFKMQIWKILLLAGPMLVASTFLTAIAMYYGLGYYQEDDFPFTACVLFGAIISATDPVAVVSLLKELGASKQVATMIEGESLLNDGTAVVLFTIVLEVLSKDCVATPGFIATSFLRLTGGGFLCGCFFYFLLEWSLSNIHNNPVLEVNLTICFAYLTFFVAEVTALKVSGIIAIVILGLFMSRKGKTKISSESELAVHHVWSYIGFVAETVIFILGGMMITFKNLELEIFTWKNFGRSMILYVFITLIRFVLLLCLKPIMTRTGYPMDMRHVILMTWGALRGSLGIFLALVVSINKSVPSNIAGTILFHASMIALYTLVINATTMPALVKKLKLSKETVIT